MSSDRRPRRSRRRMRHPLLRELDPVRCRRCSEVVGFRRGDAREAIWVCWLCGTDTTVPWPLPVDEPG